MEVVSYNLSKSKRKIFFLLAR